MKYGLSFLFGFHGRIRRSEWWLSRLIIFGMLTIGTMVLVGLAAIIAPHGKPATGGDEAAGVAGVVLGLLIAVGIGVMAWIHLATSVKRLHDQDISGWVALVSFIPGIGPLFSLVVLGCLDSQPWTNPHGPSPKPGYGQPRQPGQFA